MGPGTSIGGISNIMEPVPITNRNTTNLNIRHAIGSGPYSPGSLVSMAQAVMRELRRPPSIFTRFASPGPTPRTHTAKRDNIVQIHADKFNKFARLLSDRTIELPKPTGTMYSLQVEALFRLPKDTQEIVFPRLNQEWRKELVKISPTLMFWENVNKNENVKIRNELAAAVKDGTLFKSASFLGLNKHTEQPRPGTVSPYQNAKGLLDESLASLGRDMIAAIEADGTCEKQPTIRWLSQRHQNDPEKFKKEGYPEKFRRTQEAAGREAGAQIVVRIKYQLVQAMINGESLIEHIKADPLYQKLVQCEINDTGFSGGTWKVVKDEALREIGAQLFHAARKTNLPVPIGEDEQEQMSVPEYMRRVITVETCAQAAMEDNFNPETDYQLEKNNLYKSMVECRANAPALFEKVFLPQCVKIHSAMAEQVIASAMDIPPYQNRLDQEVALFAIKNPDWYRAGGCENFMNKVHAFMAAELSAEAATTGATIDDLATALMTKIGKYCCVWENFQEHIDARRAKGDEGYMEGVDENNFGPHLLADGFIEEIENLSEHYHAEQQRGIEGAENLAALYCEFLELAKHVLNLRAKIAALATTNKSTAHVEPSPRQDNTLTWKPATPRAIVQASTLKNSPDPKPENRSVRFSETARLLIETDLANDAVVSLDEKPELVCVDAQFPTDDLGSTRNVDPPYLTDETTQTPLRSLIDNVYKAAK